MSGSNGKIGIIDTTLRDAHQCLWATRMTTAHMLPVAEAMDNAGFEQIDLAGPIQFDVCVRYLNEDPWERVRLMRSRIEKTPLRFLVRSKNLMTFDMLPDDILELWVERVVANGFRIVGTFDGLNDTGNIIASTRLAKKLGAKTFGALSYSLSPVHTDELYVKTAKELVESGVIDHIMLKDAAGLLTVDRIRTLVPAIKRVIGDIPLEIHGHCLTGLAPLVYLEAVKCGADLLHTSIAPMANGPAQPSTQSTARNLRLMGYDVPVDDAGLGHVGEHFRRIAEAEDKPLGELLEYDEFHYRHQMPGGMLSNFKSQLAQAGLADRYDHLLEEVARVREELGYPIMITPFAQLVGTQAVLNVVHGERYRVVPNEIKKYALGYYGKLLAPVVPDVIDRIVENGSKQIALKPVAPEPAVAALRKKYPNASDEERLLRYMFAGSQVDDMLRGKTSMTQEYQHEHSVVGLLKNLSKRPRIGRVHISRGDFQLEISGS
jgi:oxaloacetate decarboxylase (Na+ extruding) subunit alpha